MSSFKTVREEVVLDTPPKQNTAIPTSPKFLVRSFLTKDRKTLVKVYAENSSHTASINPFAVKECFDEEVEVDTGVEDPELAFQARVDQGDDQAQLKVFYVFDKSIKHDSIYQHINQDMDWLQQHQIKSSIITTNDNSTSTSILLKKQTGDPCPQCDAEGHQGALKVTKAIEVGHTFHLGDRYSSKLDLLVPSANQPNTYVSMGCHGIGTSRLIAAAASALSDTTGLIWPRAIAPFDVLIVVSKLRNASADPIGISNQIYDDLASHIHSPADVLIDDRHDVGMGWKLKDADLIGYPVVVVLGKGWEKNKLVEVQCRRLKIREEVSLSDVPDRVRELLLLL